MYAGRGNRENTTETAGWKNTRRAASSGLAEDVNVHDETNESIFLMTDEEKKKQILENRKDNNNKNIRSQLKIEIMGTTDAE